MMRLRGWLVLNGLAAGLLLGLAEPASAGGKVLVETESLYHYIRVEAEGSVRWLLFRRRGEDHSESAVDLTRPLEPQLRYVKLMFSGLLYCPEPKDILIVGLGGGSLSTMFAHHFPKARVVTVELDPKVVEIAKEYFGFKETERNRVEVRDGRVYIKRALRKPDERYDLILLDAYRGGFIPYHLTTREFLIECKALLKPGGVLISNMRTDFQTYDYQRRTMDKVFPTCRAFSSGGNTVVCALPEKTAMTGLEMTKRAKEIQQQRNLQFRLLDVVKARQDKPDYDRHGEIFTDDYAPANILRRE